MIAKQARGNPWLHIWTQPRQTIRSLVDADPKFGFGILSAIYGLPMALNLAQNISLGAKIPTWAILIGALIICTFLGMIGFSIVTWLLYVTGRWIGGRGSYQTIRTAVTWSNMPNSITILMWIVLLAVFGGALFHKQFSETHFIGYEAGIVFIVFLIQLVVSIWGFVILLQGLSEVQEFSMWKALLNILIPCAIVIGVIWLWWAMFGTQTIH